MVQTNLKKLIDYIGNKDSLQQKYLRNVIGAMAEEETEELEAILDFFLRDNTIEGLGDAYLLFLDNTWEETKYFITEGHYRHSSVSEVIEKVYYNEKYMKQYMIGLQLSGYLWKTHKIINSWYKEKLKAFKGNYYLEIGPGHGQYFLEAMNLHNFKHYVGIDLSPTSIELASRYIGKFVEDKTVDNSLICRDFLEMQFHNVFDGVCIAEVLEHTEKPEKILQKIYDLTTIGGNVYVSVPINGPAIDHIYLFASIEEFLELVKSVGFVVKDYIYATEADNISYEEALKRRCTILLAVHLQHK